ncbi:aromatase/cyclase [Streptomyces sp. NBC_00385]|uniref:aromatase/cyclase n=1 Tax=Streptomyces sp. NBC_00385 TaxID=2975733 RepID=UPI002DD90B85|nr:aromatase/cyclase [Streptomyces sp. NBC_00385]WRZ04095.1 aromatase/cyclase [Streptomyces sp. NBC_00385]
MASTGTPRTGKHLTRHETEIAASAQRVYDIIADAAAWPLHFTPTIHVERTALGPADERLEIWANANGEVKHWTSHRELDAAKYRVTFRQEVSSPPVASMGGEWIVEPLAEESCRLVLLHDFDAVGDTAENVAWVERATDRNSRTELANIKALAEEWERRQELVFSFEDSVVVHGSPEEVYDFLYDAKRWSERLPHVGSIDLREDVENVQQMSMLTVTADGSSHTTESVRVCFPATPDGAPGDVPARIVYKQLVPPSLMTAHLGTWRFEPVPGGVRATSAHTVTINEATIARVLGPQAGADDAKQAVRNGAGGNSRATLGLAKEFAEGRDKR